MDFFMNIQNAILKGYINNINELVQNALSNGFTAKQIIDKGLIIGMEKVAVLFKRNEMYIPEVLISAKCMHLALDVLKPLLEKSNDNIARGSIAIGTVKGDLHDIGKNLVAMMLKGAGYEVKDLGVDQPAERFVKTVIEDGVKVLGLSCLLTTTMPQIPHVIRALEEANVRKKVKLIVGGAPITLSFAESVGADGYAADAGSAVGLVNQMMSSN